jgi:hypothetical protein
MTPNINLFFSFKIKVMTSQKRHTPVLAPHRDVRAMSIPRNRRDISRLREQAVHGCGRPDLFGGGIHGEYEREDDGEEHRRVRAVV